ncbi:MAG: glycosyl transferase, partial [Clostridiales bacterium]|nr:glycosyl transferase [Clostridiales bacterium]
MPIKTLHYCWFGGNPLPKSAVEYMKSWEKFCPDFEIKRWDETNFDVESVPFVKEAYAAKKYAFVADYVRTLALYNEGGLYVDTDVEFIKPIDDLTETSFMGFENPEVVAPGLILYACEPKHEIYGKILDHYNNLKFDDSIKSQISSPKIYTEILERFGLKKDNSLQTVGNIKIYPTEYFQPLGDKRYGLKKRITENTRTIHHYDASWVDKKERQLYLLKVRHGNFWGKAIFAFRHPFYS